MRLRQIALVTVLLTTLLVACGNDDKASDQAAGSAPTVAATRAATTAAAGATTATAATATQAPALRGDLAVFAAASLTDAFTEIGAEFQKANPNVAVKFNFAASSALRTQLEQGAKADVFASADEIQMENAKKAGVIIGESPIFVKNKLVVIYPASNPGRVTSIQDLARPGLKFVLTDKAVPIGAYARTALEKLSADPQYGADFGQRVLANLKSEEANVRAVVTKVQLGEADAGIVYASDVTPAVAKDITSILIPDAFNTIATYPIAVVKDAPNAAAARAFIAFVRSAKGQEILKKNNFITDRDTGMARLLQPEISGSFAAQMEPARAYSPAFIVQGAVDQMRAYTLEDLQALPSVELPVEYRSGNTSVATTYRGVLLHDLLLAAQPRFDPANRNDKLRSIVLVTATDGYQAVIAWGEIDPDFAAKQVLVAYEENGELLGDSDGMARLVVPGDSRGGRYVSNIISITLMPAGE